MKCTCSRSGRQKLGGGYLLVPSTVATGQHGFGDNDFSCCTVGPRLENMELQLQHGNGGFMSLGTQAMKQQLEAVTESGCFYSGHVCKLNVKEKIRPEREKLMEQMQSVS